MATRPERTEAAPYYFTYIDKVPAGDVCELLTAQLAEVLALARSITEPQSLSRYAPGKWSMRDVMKHITDCERLFVGRAFWFARGFQSPLPSFDQEVAVEAAWDRRGIASDNPFTVRALAYMCAGHVTHHLVILRERYVRA
jgi:hypothetical protein